MLLVVLMEEIVFELDFSKQMIDLKLGVIF